MQKKKMLQEFLGHRFLVFALFMLIFSGGLKAAEEEYQKKKISVQIVVSGWANTSCRFDFSQERSLCLSYVYVQW